MNTVKICERGERNLFTYANNSIWYWDGENMSLLLVGQEVKDWYRFLLNYKNLGAEIVDAYSGYNIERSTLNGLIDS